MAEQEKEILDELDRIKELSATPYSTHLPDVPGVTFHEPSADAEIAAPKLPTSRRLYIKQANVLQ